MKPHALTLGCTGMLADAALGLEADGYAVSYLSRSGKRPASSHATSHSCDWNSETSLHAAARDAIIQHGTPQLALVWTHKIGQALRLARAISAPGQSLRFHHVLGSSLSDPSRKNAIERVRLGFSELLGVDWRAIRLGFKRDGNVSRWLTHEEISHGALEAVRLQTPIYTIGQTSPWKLRPK